MIKPWAAVPPAALLLLAGPAAPGRAIQVERIYGPLSGNRATEVVAGQAMLRFDPGVRDHAAVLAGFGAGVVREFDTIGWTVVSLPSGASVPAGIALLKSAPGVLEAAPNHVYRALRTPNDPQASAQWHLQTIRAYEAWAYETGASSRVTAAIIDSGIEGAHPDLLDKLVLTDQAFVPLTGVRSDNDPPTAACNHATRVAGVAAAATDNAAGVAGLSWGARLVSLKVFLDADCNAQCCSPLGDCGVGNTCASDTPAIIAALNYAADTLHNSTAAGRVVVNISLGMPAVCPPGIQAAVTNAVNKGVVVVAAAGNDGGAVQSPANCVGVLPVGATDSGDNIASFSSRGGVLAGGGLVAPGVGIVTTDLGGGVTNSATGTSFASPMAAGIAALTLSYRPTMSVSDVGAVLRNSADMIGPAILGAGSYQAAGNAQGAGRLNANTAMILTVNGLTAFPEEDSGPIIFPNPFRPASASKTTIILPSAAKASFTGIKIFTIDGRLVRDLKGQSWDGNNDAGNPVATGTYIVLVTTDGKPYRGKVAVIR